MKEQGSVITVACRGKRKSQHCAATQRETNTPYAITINDNVDRWLRKWVANSGHLHPVIPNANCMRCIMRGASAAFLTNYRKLQEMLNEICAINAELLRRRESLD